ncbi:MAG: hypothetical protein IPN98_18090 [Propionivibrio sp.]|nr:hypothetical protein [Propionivibrio sp.]
MRSREAIATEMGKLIAALPATGTAVLSADDELVLAMAAKSVRGPNLRCFAPG